MFNKILLTLLTATLMGSINANPMRPDNTLTTLKVVTPAPAPVSQPPQLSNIVVMGDYRLAFFNGNNGNEVGDVISGYRLTLIEPTYVMVERNNKATRLEIQSTGSLSIEPTDEDIKP